MYPKPPSAVPLVVVYGPLCGNAVDKSSIATAVTCFLSMPHRRSFTSFSKLVSVILSI